MAASRVQLSSMPNALLLRPGTFLPAAGASANVYAHDTTSPVVVYAAESGPGTLSQPLVADANGQLPGWVLAEQDLDVVPTTAGAVAAMAVPMRAADLVGGDGLIGGSGSLGLSPTGVAAGLPSTVGIDSSQFATYYVLPASAGGSDAKDGLSPGKAFATFANAYANVVADGGGHIKLGPGNAIYPASTPFQINLSNFRLSGIPGLTTLTPSVSTDGRIQVHLVDDGTQTSEVHFEDLIIDLRTTLGAQCIMGAVTDWSWRNIRIRGGTFPAVFGGALLPCQRGWVRWLRITDPSSSLQFAIAPVNVDQLDIGDWWIVGDGSYVGSALDCETNAQTDYIRDLKMHHGRVIKMSGVGMAGGATSQLDRMVGCEYTDNLHIDSSGLICNLPAAKIARNTFIYTSRSHPSADIPSGGISILRADYGLSADNVTIKDNTLIDMQKQTGSAITLEASHAKVSGNKIIDRRGQVTWGVEEVQTLACVLSGGVVTPVSGLQVAVSALVFQQASAGTILNVAATTLTLAAASAYDRVDAIVANETTGALSVVQGVAPPAGLPPAANVGGGSGTQIAQIYVATGAVTLAATDIQDVRPFAPNHNQIEQDTPAQPALLYGASRLIGSASRRIVPARRFVQDAYSRSVLSDQPILYLPLQESDGLIAADLSGNGFDGVYRGGITLNQQIGVTTRHGALFDGSSGYVQLPRPEFLIAKALCRQPFTVEAQILQSAAGSAWILEQGFSASQDFEWAVDFNNLYSQLGNSMAWQVGTTNLGTTTLHHVALDWDGTNLNYYIDGAADSHGAFTPGAPTYTENDPGYSEWPIWIGATTNSGLPAPDSSFFPGFIRCVAMYAPNIGATRIAAHAALM